MKFLKKTKQKFFIFPLITLFLVGCNTSFKYPDITKAKLEVFASKGLKKFFTFDDKNSIDKKNFINWWIFDSDINNLYSKPFFSNEQKPIVFENFFTEFLSKDPVKSDLISDNYKSNWGNIQNKFNDKYKNLALNNDFKFSFESLFKFPLTQILKIQNISLNWLSLSELCNNEFSNFFDKNGKIVPNYFLTSFHKSFIDTQNDKLDPLKFFEDFIFYFFYDFYIDAFYNNIKLDKNTLSAKCNNFQDNKNSSSCTITSLVTYNVGNNWKLLFSIPNFDITTKIDNTKVYFSYVH